MTNTEETNIIANLPGYQILESLYTGTRTLVCRGIRESDRRRVVIKVLRNSFPRINDLVKFRNQYVITRRLEHPIIVQPLALERYGNGYALVMPDEGAIVLSDYWQASSRSLTEFFRIALQLAEVLHFLSQQHIIHKDIKPSNILIHPDTHQVQLIDFSISSLLPKERQQLTNPNILEGTLAYISPEQTGRMNRGIDYRTDFYSLGVTLFELLTGKLPFAASDPMELVHCHIAQNVQWPVASGQWKTPEMVQAIVLKMMAKNAEDRYQSALGLKHDLERCVQQLEAEGSIQTFELGERDRCDRFLIPEKLYGREKEVAQLLAAFERVSQGAGEAGEAGEQRRKLRIPNSVSEAPRPEALRTPLAQPAQSAYSELLLVTGFSGIGKTAVINEVHKPIVQQRGYFIKGKFDQFNRNIPFSAIVHAFRDLMGQLLSESDTNLAHWKGKILNALGNNAQVIIDVVPELESIVGQQPSVPELSGSAAQNRFNLLFQKFIAVFSIPDHPVVMFLDDLQWADSASLNLMKVLIGGDTGYLLILGAYRDNEVFPAHPLILALDEIKKQGANLNTLTLAPLTEREIMHWIADMLLCSVEIASPLSQLVYQKTRGNPFFTIQFMQGLHEDGWITYVPPQSSFDRKGSQGGWQCDFSQVRQLALTDDVMEFMVGRLQKLPEVTQDTLKRAACIGNRFDLETVAMVCESSQSEIAANLWIGLQEGYIVPESEIYKFCQWEQQHVAEVESISVGYHFVHDRIQQAAYALIPDKQKEITHYQIGQLLLQQISPHTQDENFFELINQLNYGTNLITDPAEREQLAHLNLIACRKARAATAYKAGREYARIGLSLLGEQAWQRHYEMSLAFHELAAEFASLCGDFVVMEQWVEQVIEHSQSLFDQADVYQIRIQAYVSQNQLPQAIAIAQKFLQQLDVSLPETPTEMEIQKAITDVGQLIGDRDIEDFIQLPPMTNERAIAIVQIANSVIPASYSAGSSLFPLLVALSVKLSIQHGNTTGSVLAYANYGIITCNFLENMDMGVKFGELALQMLSQLETQTAHSHVLQAVGIFILHRKYPVKDTLPLLQQGYANALELGNLEFVGYAAEAFCLNSFWCGQPLANIEKDAHDYYHALVHFNQSATANYCQLCWQLTLNLQGCVKDPIVFSGEALEETELLSRLLSGHDVYELALFYSYKLMLCYLFGEIEAAQRHAVEMRRYLMGGMGTVMVPAFYFYDSLTALAAVSKNIADLSEVLPRIGQNQAELQQHWSNHAPMNHQHKVDLVDAQKCHTLGQKAEAIDRYDQAIAGAKANGYIQEEALANELAAQFYLGWGKEKIAATYIQGAHYCYTRWGAKAKTDDLERRYPGLLQLILQDEVQTLDPLGLLAEATTPNLSISTTTASRSSSARFTTLDIAAILKASQNLSDTIRLEELLRQLTQIILQHSGGDRCALILPRDDGIWQVEVIATPETTNRCSAPLETHNTLPVKLIQYVKNTQDAVVIDDLDTDLSVIDDYLRRQRPQSVLCLPILSQGQLIGILYVANQGTRGVFTSDRILILNFLCTQAAISLKNAQLYSDLTQAKQLLADYNLELERQVTERTQALSQALEDLQATQSELIQSEKMAALGQLIAGVAHELNTPLGTICSSAGHLTQFIQTQLQQLPSFFQNLPPARQDDFCILLQHNQPMGLLSTREQRQLKHVSSPPNSNLTVLNRPQNLPIFWWELGFTII